MKFKGLSFVVFLIILLLCVTCVSAANDTQTDSINEKVSGVGPTDSDLTNINSRDNTNIIKSYDDLNKQVLECNGTIDLQYDYKYAENNVNIINLRNRNLTINGNNHIIDGSETAGAFNIVSESLIKNTIIFNNLTFINMNLSTIEGANLLVEFNNVKFANTTAEESAQVMLYDSEVELNNCTFENIDEFSCIVFLSTDAKLNNTTFVNSTVATATIQVNRGTFSIDNSIFENITSEYGGAINYKGDVFNITNTKFHNIYSNVTGGALLMKYFPRFNDDETLLYRGPMLIENCEFVNMSSEHDGGSIYIDLDSGSSYVPQTLNVINSTFNYSFSEFGGAILDLGGNVNLVNSSFANGKAKTMGGALYTSYANLTITNCDFIDNFAGNAAVIYYDKGRLNIDNSRFINNRAASSSKDKTNAIYANDADITIKNSVFDNGGVSLYGNFVEKYKLDNVTSTDIFSMNNTDYIFSVENKGIKLNITNISVADEIPEKYDLRNYGWVGPVQNQGDNLSCWAFANAAAIETSLKKFTNVSYDVSEDNIQNLQLRYFIMGDTRNNATGFAYSALGHSLSWYGIVMEEDDPYDMRGMISDVVTTDNRIHLQDARIIFGGRNDTIDTIKRTIMTYGPVTIQFNPTTTYNYRSDEDTQPIHFVPLIGWDDTIPAEKFKQTANDGDSTAIPPGPGGWIFRDSAGDPYGDEGFAYLSYYDNSFLAMDYFAVIGQNAGIAYIFNNTNDYHVNYQTDLTGLTGFDANYTRYSNEFTSKYDEYIGAVGTYFNDSGIEYSFDVYVNNRLMHSQSGISDFAGFKTIILDKYVPIKKDDTFKVAFKSNAVPYQAFSRMHYIKNMSLVSNDGEHWIDLADTNKTVCLKIYTIDSRDENENNTAPADKSGIKPVKDRYSRNIQKNNLLKSSQNVHVIRLAADNSIIYRGNYLTLEALNNIFGRNFTNGHLLVYVDGELVFNDTVTDDITTIIIELIEKYLGKHEIKVEFTDNNKTSTYKEIVIIE